MQLDKSHATLEGDDIVLPGKIVKMAQEEGAPFTKEKYMFLPEDTQVMIRYNQDTGTGEISILNHPLDLYETSEIQEDTLEKEAVVSRIIQNLNQLFIACNVYKKPLSE